MRWFKDNAWWILLICVGVAGFVIAKMTGRKDAGTIEGLKKELAFEKQIIDERAVVAKRLATEDHAKVVTSIRRKHADAIRALSADEKKLVKELSDDPEALLDHLLRLGA